MLVVFVHFRAFMAKRINSPPQHTHIPDLQQGSIDQTVTFTPQDNESCVDFLIYDDDLALEPTETLRFTLSNLDNGSHVFGLYNTTYVGIMDDDGKMIRSCVCVCVYCIQCMPLLLELLFLYQKSTQFFPTTPFFCNPHIHTTLLHLLYAVTIPIPSPQSSFFPW